MMSLVFLGQRVDLRLRDVLACKEYMLIEGHGVAFPALALRRKAPLGPAQRLRAERPKRPERAKTPGAGRLRPHPQRMVPVQPSTGAIAAELYAVYRAQQGQIMRHALRARRPAARTPGKGRPNLVPYRACLTEWPALWLRPRKSTT